MSQDKTLSRTTTLEENGEPKRIQTEVSLLTSLGQTSSPDVYVRAFMLFLPRSIGPIHTPHAVADLNQSETRNIVIFTPDFCPTRWYHKQRLGKHWLSAVLSILVQSP